MQPTVGVRERFGNFPDLVFRPDAVTGGGVFVTSDPNIAASLNDVPEGVILTENNTPVTSPVTDESITRSQGRNSQVDELRSANSTPFDNVASQPPTLPVANNVNAGSISSLESIPGNMFDWGECLFIQSP